MPIGPADWVKKLVETKPEVKPVVPVAQIVEKPVVPVKEEVKPVPPAAPVATPAPVAAPVTATPPPVVK
jgi:uncharacterized membrane-anchored protein